MNLTIISNSTKGISRPLISNESEAIEAQVEEKSLLALHSIFFFFKKMTIYLTN